MGENYDLEIGMNFLSNAQKIITINYKKRLLTITALKLRVSVPQHTYEGNKNILQTEIFSAKRHFVWKWLGTRYQKTHE